MTVRQNKCGVFKRQGGFTMVEIGIVLLISGFTMLVAANFVKQYMVDTRYQKTLEHLKIAKEALGEYYAVRGGYPCPADPTLGPGDAGYGEANCRWLSGGPFDPDTCLAPAYDNIVCTTDFSRNGDQVGGDDVVVIGALPFRTLADEMASRPGGTQFFENHRLDGYGTMLTYAVTEHMTRNKTIVNPANPNTGAIRVEDENRLSVTTPDDSAHFVVFSHGDNGRGGYTPEGRMIGDCMVSSGMPFPNPPMIPPAPGPRTGTMEVEIENCDNNDAIFVQGIRSLGDNDDFNDDILVYKATGTRALWRRSAVSPAGETYIYNTNVGNVGVGTNDPQERLHVFGSISAQGSTVSGSSEYCNQTGIDCLDPEFIAGAGFTCPGNQVAYAVGNNRFECRDITWAPIVNKECGVHSTSGQPTFMRGFSNMGTLYCCHADGTSCEMQ